MFIYGYEDLLKDIEKIKTKSYAAVFSVGKSLCGREIFCIKCGFGNNKVFYNAAHHGLESVASSLLVKFALSLDDMCCAKLLDAASIYIVPMVNPDGVQIVKDGDMHWQANARGVDLNHNYNAGWLIAKAMEPEYGVCGPGPTRFGGEFPESEPETGAIADFSRKMNFSLALAYHTQGEEIYYTYMDYCPVKARKIADRLSAASGYRLSEPGGIASYGGFKDWFIKEFSKPAFTIEAGRGQNPLPYSDITKIYNENKELLSIAPLL